MIKRFFWPARPPLTSEQKARRHAANRLAIGIVVAVIYFVVMLLFVYHVRFAVPVVIVDH